MNIVLQLKEHIIVSLGKRILREIETSKSALRDFGLPTTMRVDPGPFVNDYEAFTLIMRDAVLKTEIREFIDEFVRENKGSSHLHETAPNHTVISVIHVDGLKRVIVNRIHHKLNIALLNA